MSDQQPYKRRHVVAKWLAHPDVRQTAIDVGVVLGGPKLYRHLQNPRTKRRISAFGSRHHLGRFVPGPLKRAHEAISGRMSSLRIPGLQKQMGKTVMTRDERRMAVKIESGRLHPDVLARVTDVSHLPGRVNLPRTPAWKIRALVRPSQARKTVNHYLADAGITRRPDRVFKDEAHVRAAAKLFELKRSKLGLYRKIATEIGPEKRRAVASAFKLAWRGARV